MFLKDHCGFYVAVTKKGQRLKQGIERLNGLAKVTWVQGRKLESSHHITPSRSVSRRALPGRHILMLGWPRVWAVGVSPELHTAVRY